LRYYIIPVADLTLEDLKEIVPHHVYREHTDPNDLTQFNEIISAPKSLDGLSYIVKLQSLVAVPDDKRSLFHTPLTQKQMSVIRTSPAWNDSAVKAQRTADLFNAIAPNKVWGRDTIVDGDIDPERLDTYLVGLGATRERIDEIKSRLPPFGG